MASCSGRRGMLALAALSVACGGRTPLDVAAPDAAPPSTVDASVVVTPDVCSLQTLVVSKPIELGNAGTQANSPPSIAVSGDGRYYLVIWPGSTAMQVSVMDTSEGTVSAPLSMPAVAATYDSGDFVVLEAVQTQEPSDGGPWPESFVLTWVGMDGAPTGKAIQYDDAQGSVWPSAALVVTPSGFATTLWLSDHPYYAVLALDGTLTAAPLAPGVCCLQGWAAGLGGAVFVETGDTGPISGGDFAPPVTILGPEPSSPGNAPSITLEDAGAIVTPIVSARGKLYVATQDSQGNGKLSIGTPEAGFSVAGSLSSFTEGLAVDGCGRIVTLVPASGTVAAGLWQAPPSSFQLLDDDATLFPGPLPVAIVGGPSGFGAVWIESDGSVEFGQLTWTP